MPIRLENRNRYPKNWKKISKKIIERSGGQCEFIIYGKRCEAKQYQPHPITKSKVVLTVAHLNHIPEDCRDNNLKAGCQRCHNRYDAKNRAKGIKERKILKIKKEHKNLWNFKTKDVNADIDYVPSKDAKLMEK